MTIMQFVLDEGSDGRVSEAFTYLLLCRDEERIYIKVGHTIDPYKRFLSLRNGCPVTPRSFSVVGFPSVKFACKMERAFHEAFGKWRVTGEWFAMAAADKAEFNERLREAMQETAIPGWPMRLTKIATKPISDLAERRQRFFRRMYSKRGKAYQDFHRDAKPRTRLGTV